MRHATKCLFLFMTCAAAALAGPEEHLLNRLGYGPDRWTETRLKDLGRVAYIDEQLSPATIPDGPFQQDFNGDAQFDAWRMTLPQAWNTFRPNKPRRPAVAFRQASNEQLLRMISSRRQLQALLTEFWFNHFNVDLGGVELNYLIPYVRDTIRPNVLGRFEDLLLAVARSPAMLTYLDNKDNFKKDYLVGGIEKGVNENYARELMELHTLGVDDQGKPYDQQDVIAVARCLTGWTLTPGVGFRFDAAGHDQGQKRPLGLVIQANGGEQDGKAVLHRLATHPRTAFNIARKLTVFFLGKADAEVVKAAAAVFHSTEGDLRAVTRAILMRPEFLASTNDRVRRPTVLLASALRSVAANLGSGEARFARLSAIWDACTDLGQPLYAVPPPTGWIDAEGTFLSEGYMTLRFQLLQQLFAGGERLPTAFDPNSTGGPTVLVKRIGDRVLGVGGLSAQTSQAIERYLATNDQNADLEARTALALVFSSPEFARH